MSAFGSSAAAYGAASRALGTPRSIEHDLFSEITGRLSRAAGPGGSFSDLASALNDNMALWRTLALDLTAPDNALPEALRAQLLSLATFVERHTALVIARKASADPIIEINTAIMRGLRGQLAA
ncbi:MAG: flagellar biosynthesis regulator FlaF [Pseudomonadota bacterium]